MNQAFSQFDALAGVASNAMMGSHAMIDFWGSLLDRGVGRSFTPSQADDAVDFWVLKSKRAGRSHALAELSTRRALASDLVAASAWEEVRNRAGEVAGWRWTKYGIAALRAIADCSGIDLPDWAVER